MGLQQTISYKDPSGFVVKLDDGYHRIVSNSYKKEFDHLENSGLYQELIDKGLMVKHQAVELADAYAGNYKQIYPEQLSFISYPFEWSYGQWRQMIIAYLRINEMAMAHGMILKDASPYNFTYVNERCVLIDTLSFDFYEDGTPWKAYRQFCEEILSPFLLMHYKDPLWARLSRASITGLPLPFVSAQLPFSTRFNNLCLMHIHLHARFKTKGGSGSTASAGGGFNKQKLNYLFGSIKDGVKKYKAPLLRNSIWDEYYENDIESEKYMADKISVIKTWLGNAKPKATVDIGANTGKFSVIAAEFSEKVYALEGDIYCVEDIYKAIKKIPGNKITTVVADIVDPSPGLGWANTEKASLLQRINGDMIMALAVIHHLCLTRNIPLHFVAKLFADMTTRYAIVEFVPKEDNKSQLLLKNKGDIFDEYTEAHFVECFSQHFKPAAVHSCEDSLRKLYLWEKL
ncbi:SAM-dependent methyltransferase [Mucilaginibacter pedocola]|uniref:Nodulation protein NoeA n=1 Tax=Mucilaginibacter pedocola TaxID=1792845 RepID=A0A1S9PF54_9SPHI|nr:hypothetical protein [Mucilaginibacter pedocola]OOQ59562.1 hypothetical protein BC343_05180 [Mucilaginibacter pedocola]